MGVYKACKEDGVAWITGASTGIGRALAIELARRGYTVAATARDETQLHSITDEATALKGRIFVFPCNVMDEAAMETAVAEIEKQLGPIVLAVFNAGVYLPVRGGRLETVNFKRSFEINVLGVVHGLVPLVDRMKERGFGQIAVTGSVTAFYGMPSTAAYGASKSALNTMLEALRFDLRKLNIRTQIINPGFVATPLTEKARFRMPAQLTAKDAAQRIAKGLEKGGYEISFPRRLTWPLKLLGLLPRNAIHHILYRLTGWHKTPVGPRVGPRKERVRTPGQPRDGGASRQKR